MNISDNTWFTYFDNLLNNIRDVDEDFKAEICNTIINHDLQCAECDEGNPHELNTDITLSEVENVLNNLENNKSPDGLPYEILKHSSNVIAVYLCDLFNAILSTGIYPDMWCEAIISPLYKKGSKSDVNNYRGISLSCTLGKVFTKILNSRMMSWAAARNKIDNSQGAYQKDKSTIDHIFTLMAIVQKYLSKTGGRFYCAFIDFSKCFDSIPHLQLWYRLINEGIHGRVLKVLRSMYGKLKSRVKTANGLTVLFECITGTRQGCMLSPFLFILYLNELVNMCKDNCPGIFVDDAMSNVHMLLYADDIAMVNDTIGRLQKQLNIFSDFCYKYGLTVNMSKTNVMIFRNGGRIRSNEKVYFNNEQIAETTYYKYLGIVFSSRLCWTTALKTLSSQADKSIYTIKFINRECNGLPAQLLFDLFDKLVLPILLYGAEIWGYTIREEIEIVHRKFCKYVLCVSSHVPSAAVLGECGRLPLSTHYIFRCVKYWVKLVNGHNVFTHSCYNLLKILSDNGRTTWASNVKHVLYICMGTDTFGLTKVLEMSYCSWKTLS